MKATRSFLALLCIFLCFQSKSQCSSTAALSGSNFSDDNSIGNLAFSSPANAATSNNSRCSASALITLLTGNTHYLKATGFNFAIPSSAAICGILLEVEKSASNISLLATVTDNSVRLVKDGAITGNNYAAAAEWSTTEAYFSYGGVADLWGTTWTPDDINDPDFGMVFSAHIIGLITLLPSARIDHVRMTVYYNVVLPVRITSFKAVAIDEESNMLQWTSVNNNEQADFIIESSEDGNDWKQIGAISAETNTGKVYQFIDRNNSNVYYRLQVKYGHGHTEYSNIINVSKTKKTLFSLYPNPATQRLYIESDEKISGLKCITSCGRQYDLSYNKSAANQYAINISELPAGIFLLHVNGKKIPFIKQ